MIFTSDGGIGESPAKAVIHRAIQLLTNNSSDWIAHGAYKRLNWHGAVDVIDPRRASRLQAHGMLAYLHLAVVHIAPEPISPHLLRHAFEGRANFVIDQPWLKSIDEEALVSLRAWYDWDKRSPVSPASPLGALLASAEISVSRSSCSTLQHTHLPL